MTHFDDGTPYTYAHCLQGPTTPVLNIGWLDRSREFPVGTTSAEFRDKLAWLCLRKQVLPARGIHACNICPAVKNGFHSIEIDGRKHELGSAEIRVAGSQVQYAAPNLILHYVVDHRYLPPEDFVASVIALPDSLETGSWTVVRGNPWHTKNGQGERDEKRWWVFWK
jgi:hypothetical protein